MRVRVVASAAVSRRCHGEHPRQRHGARTPRLVCSARDGEGDLPAQQERTAGTGDRAERATAALPEQPASSQQRTALRGTILLVDDDRGLQQAIGAILEDEGYDVIPAFDGLDALAKLAARPPDLILLDIGMPNLDGLGFAEELRRRAVLPAMPILVLTADEHASAKARSVGAADFLNKPFQLEELVQRVSNLLPELQTG
jgi:CheY-like chemotaxis protein